jgi:hypothetical protein
VVEELKPPNLNKTDNCANLSFEVEIERQVSFTKLDYCQYLHNLVYSKQLPFARVLMDSWYAAQKLMALIEQLGKIYYCTSETKSLGR